MIREATHADIPQLLQGAEQMHAESPRFSRMRFSAAKLEATLRAVIGAPQGFAWVAEREGVIVAGLVAMVGEHWASEDLIASDLALFVHPEHRGSLAFVRLVNRYRAWARERGAVLRQLGITTGLNTNETAALLERLGMKRCGVILED